MSQSKTWIAEFHIPTTSLKKINDYMWPDTPVPTGIEPGYPLMAFSSRFDNGITVMLMIYKGERSCYMLAPVFNEAGVALDPDIIDVTALEVLHGDDKLEFVYKQESYVVQIVEEF
ncbi:hypothetical protein BH10PSE19_BH10PSE19_05570 [soil metagenome]